MKQILFLKIFPNLISLCWYFIFSIYLNDSTLQFFFFFSILTWLQMF